MPQPLFKVISGRVKVEIGPETIKSRPRLALQAFSVISHWAAVEAALAQLAASITGGKAMPVVDYFCDLTADSPKMAVLRTLAMSHLTKSRLEVFEILLTLYGTAQKLRNPIAHGIWGICDRLPDALLVIDPRDSLKISGKRDTLKREVDRLKTTPDDFDGVDKVMVEFDQLHVDRMKKTMVYRNKDFGVAIRDIGALYGFLTHFNNVVERDHLPPNFGSELLFQWLIRQPAIRTRLASAQSGGKGDP